MSDPEGKTVVELRIGDKHTLQLDSSTSHVGREIKEDYEKMQSTLNGNFSFNLDGKEKIYPKDKLDQSFSQAIEDIQQHYQAKIDVLQSQLDSSESEQDIIAAQVQKRLETYLKAAPILGVGPNELAKDSVDEVQKKVIQKIDSNLSLEGRNNDAIDVMFDTLVSMHKSPNSIVNRQKDTASRFVQHGLDSAEQKNKDQSDANGNAHYSHPRLTYGGASNGTN